MRELAAQYPRHGYRRIQVFLARRRSGEQLDLDCANGDVVRDLPTNGRDEALFDKGWKLPDIEPMN